MYLTAKNAYLPETRPAQYNYSTTQAGATLVGSRFADKLGGVAGTTLVGGLGDDYYSLWTGPATIVETADGGIDTLRIEYAGGTILPDFVENLVLQSKWATWGTGNGLNNILIAGATGATLDGKAGDDVLVGGAGADIFRMSAGNGSDAVYGFTPGWDQVQLGGYDIDSFDTLMRTATQQGADVQLDFANGERLVLRDVQLTNLGAADFNLSSVGVEPVPEGMTIMSGATSAWNANGVYLLNLVWNPGRLVHGRDYNIQSTFNSADPTQDATFTWSFPSSTDLNYTIKAYPSISFGVSPYGDTKNVADVAQSFPVKLSDLMNMSAQFDTGISGTKSGFNVAFDIWFTSVPNGNGSTVTDEIMIWTHKGAIDIKAPLLGMFDAGGVTGKIYHQGTYTAIVTDTDMPKGSIDLGAVFASLTQLGILSVDTYLAAVQFGSEIVGGNGSLDIKQFSLAIETPVEGGSVVKEITGAGTTVTHKPALPDTPPLTADTMIDPTVLLQKLGEGSTMVKDATGLIVGAQITHGTNAKQSETIRYDASGAKIGRDVVDGNSISHYDAAGKLTHAEQVYNSHNITTSRHYDKWWRYEGYDTESFTSDGAKVLKHYDASGAWQSTVTGRQAGETLYEEIWDKSGGYNVRSSTLDDSGNGRITYSNGQWQVERYDVYSNSDGVSTIRHYDAQNNLLGGEVARIADNGVRIASHFDKNWAMESSEYTGTASSDVIVLGNHTNVVHGGAGSDKIWAGAGADMFHFDTAINGDVDSIFGFAPQDDNISLSKAIFGRVAAAADGTMRDSGFAIDAASDAATRIIYDSRTGSLLYDSDGTGAKAAVLFAHLDPGLHLTAANFHLI